MTFEKYFILNISIVRTKMAVRQLLVDEFLVILSKLSKILPKSILKTSSHFTI